ncbi:MAG: hypothetical protein AAGH17_08135 [Pseudomonadota bacterium]
MRFTRFLTRATLMACLVSPAAAADFSDPTWPCVQRKIENLSMGLMWPHPVEDASDAISPTLAVQIGDLADTLALRRVELEDIKPLVEQFSDAHQKDVAILGQVFSRVFDTLSTRRARVIKGIGTFSLGQIELAEKIDASRQEMSDLLAQDTPDFDRIDGIEEQLDWDQLIHSDRQQSIQYLCETPQLIERRLFSISQMLQQASK